eukprot:EG_transcript_22961
MPEDGEGWNQIWVQSSGVVVHVHHKGFRSKSLPQRGGEEAGLLFNDSDSAGRNGLSGRPRPKGLLPRLWAGTLFGPGREKRLPSRPGPKGLLRLRWWLWAWTGEV